jgi:HAE1 family hydrophobic/amphiphilic exporter-1
VSLPRFALRQAVLVNLLFAIVIAAGLREARRIPVDFYPDISFNTALVDTDWIGASADEVERLVTTKIEDEIREVDGIKELRSFSQADRSNIEVEWDESLTEVEYEAALNELRAAVDRVDDLPEDAEETIIRELSVGEVNFACMISLTDVGGVGELGLREVAREMERRVERVMDVRKATLRGERERELRVYVDAERAIQYDLTVVEISRMIERNNRNVPAGTLDASGREITIRGVGSFDTPEALGATIVRKNADGTHVRLADVARIEPGFEKRRVVGRQDGHPAILIGIAKEPDSDIRELVARVRDFVEAYRPELPPGIEVAIPWDDSKIVSARMGLMVSNVSLGIVFVVLVLWLTVGFRNSMLVTLGIPFSFLCAFILFPVFDITFNLISLVAFVMVSGMLVDHAIVIAENIYRHIETGEEVSEAIVRGTEEVMWPVIATVATTLAAFVPSLMIGGTSGQFGSILPKTVIVTLIGSLLEALVVLPVHYLDWGSRQRDASAPSRFAALGGLEATSRRLRSAVDGWMDRARDAYVRGQQRLLRHRVLFLSTCLVALWASCGMQRHVPIDLFPSDFDRLFVTVRAPVDFGIERTDALMEALEEEIRDLDSIEGFTTNTGVGMLADDDPVFGVNYGLLNLSLDEARAAEDPLGTLREVHARVDAFMAAHPNGVEDVIVMAPRHGPPIGKPVAIRIQSDDYSQAKMVAAEMKAHLGMLPGVLNIEDNVPEGPLELRVELDEHRASLHGLTFTDVALALRAANDGLAATTFKDPKADEDVDIRVLLDAPRRSSISDLLHVEVRTPGGYRVQLGDVASVDVTRGFQRLYHHDARRSVVVYADVDGESATSTSINDAMRVQFEDVPQRFPGVNLTFGGEAQETQRMVDDMVSALGIALLAIYSILATLFRSYLQPLVVMSVVAFAFVGVTLGLFLTGGVLSMWVLYAIVGLAGIVVNDSLVLIDFVNRQRAGGLSAVEAVRVASRRRFRPILLTTITTIAGLLPMSLGLTGKSIVFGPFATAIVFGLAVASLLTLFVVPAIYLTVEGLGERVRGRLGARGGVDGLTTEARPAG